MIVMEEYVRPLLRRMMGFSRLFRPERHGALASEWARRQSDRRLHFLRVSVREENGELCARLSGPQGSGILSSMARSNALALIPEEATAVAPGERVLLHLIDEPEDH
jgi:molybdopterin molybdotransferase